MQFAFNRGHFAEKERLWAIAGFAILVSVLLHGISSTPLMRASDQLRTRRRREERGSDERTQRDNSGGPTRGRARA